MSKKLFMFFLFVMFFLPCRNAQAIKVDLTEKDIADAAKIGKEQGSNVAKYLKQHYKFGVENVFEENGVIRTKWSKLVMYTGLLSIKGKELPEEHKKRVLARSDLQIDIYTFGNTIDFAKDYKVHLVQKGKTIMPEQTSAIHTAYVSKKKIATSGFPKYRATVMSFFAYDKIDPNEKAEIVLMKNEKKKVVLEVNFADYK